MAASGLNEGAIKALPIPERGNRVHYFAGAMLQGIPAPRGFGVRVTTGGAKAFVLNYRLRGREFRYTIGQYPDWSALRAVREARELRQRIDRGENPLDDRAPAPATKTVADVIEDFLKRYVRSPSEAIRSVKEYERALLRQVGPVLGTVPIYELRRSQIAEMLDRVEDDHGPVQADRTLAYFRKCLNWYATRDDHFVPPIVPGMARTKPKDRARDRVLSDDELRAIWPVLDTAGTFGALVKVLLLTAQRRNEAAQMGWSEIDGGDDVWTIPAVRYKTKRAHYLPLSDAALAVINAQTKVGGCDYVFAVRGRPGNGRGADPTWQPFSGYSKSKPALDKAITAANGGKPLPNWTLHDLRRTAKTLMARAGVRPDISERVLGHVIPGVEGVYDRHSYLDEKRDALEKLAGLVERILNPSGENVGPLRQTR